MEKNFRGEGGSGSRGGTPKNQFFDFFEKNRSRHGNVLQIF